MKARILNCTIQIKGGTSISEASREAIICAMEFNCNVYFNFNGKEHYVLFDNLITQCQSESE